MNLNNNDSNRNRKDEKTSGIANISNSINEFPFLSYSNFQVGVGLKDVEISTVQIEKGKG